MFGLVRITRSLLVRYSLVLLIIAAALLFLWPGLAQNLFSSTSVLGSFVPHRHCYLEVPSLVWLHLSSDFLIGVAYVAISLTLAYLVYRARRDIPFHWIFLAFGLFIIACGATHFMEVWTLWNPTYWLSGYVKLVTAAASVATAVVLPAVVPKTLSLIGDAKTIGARRLDLEGINEQLKREIAERERAEQALRETTQTLESLFQASPLAIYSVDAEGRVLTWNPAAESIFGWSAREAVGQMLPFVGERHQEEFRRLRERVLQGEAHTNVETRRQRKDGSPIDVSISTAPLSDATGNVIGVIGITADITEQKRTKEALQSQQELLSEVVDVNPNAIFVKDIDGRYVLVNKTLAELFGATKEELIGRITSDFLDNQEDAALMARQDEEVINAQRRMVIPEESIKVRGTGQVRWFQTVKVPLAISDRQANWILGVATDITERKQTEESLRDSEERYRIVAETATDVIITIDPASKILYANNSVEKIFGYTIEELMGQDITILMPDYLRHIHEAALAHYIGTEQKHLSSWQAVQLLGLHKSGREIPIELSIGEFKRDGAHTLTGIIRDVTARRRAEEALQASEAELRALFAAMKDVIIVFDRDGRYLKVAPTDPSLLHRPANELVGRTLHEVFPATQAAIFMDVINRALEIRQPVNTEYVLNIDAAEVWFAGTASPIGEDTVLLVARDITESKRAEEALRRNEEQLQQAQKMESIGTLAGGIAHDFNNLLTVVIGNIQLAFRGVETESRPYRRLVEAEKAANRAASLTRQLLAFSRRQRLERKVINVNDTIGDIIRMLQRIIGEDVEMRIRAAADLSLIFADPAQIEQVVMNLAINARDAMPQGGELMIETRNAVLDESNQSKYPYVQPGRYVELRLSDNGTGMDENVLSHIFEPFFTTKEVGKGTGLGLAMAYGIIKQHDGYIQVSSEVGRGTTFLIYLPVVREEVREENQAIQIPLRGGTETLLVAEDEDALRKLAQDVLEGLGYRVMVARNGEEAVEIFTAQREQISLVVMDVVMPRMSGVDAAEQIHALDESVPVIFMTGYSAETVQSQLGRDGKGIDQIGAAVIQKPYSVETLGRKIREVLDAGGSQT